MERQLEVIRSITWWHFQWPWRTRFQGYSILKSNISKTVLLRDKVTKEH